MGDWHKAGDVTHYFGKIDVVVVELVDELAVGDWIGFVHHDELIFEQEVTSMQIEHQTVEAAMPGDDIALKVERKVREGCEIYRYID
jgi:translation elongation factor EF-1alpha